MINDHALGAMTGLSVPVKKAGVHRGKRSRGKGPRNPLAEAKTHAATISSAMASGNHQQAKQGALRLANALHAFTKNSLPPAESEVAQPTGDL